MRPRSWGWGCSVRGPGRSAGPALAPALHPAPARAQPRPQPARPLSCPPRAVAALPALVHCPSGPGVATLPWEVQDPGRDTGGPACCRSALRTVPLSARWPVRLCCPEAPPRPPPGCAVRTWACVQTGSAGTCVHPGRRDPGPAPQMGELRLFSGPGRTVNFYPSKKQ